ncbi:MAG TPA: VOC family protein [Gaiellaceae bacterium]|nr:VOC family protein [Gaiellaceae bacterium]
MTAFRLARLDHVSLNVSDRERSIAWYRDVLGLEQKNRPRHDDWPVFMGELGAALGLFQAHAGGDELDPSEPGLRHVAFALGRESFERARAHLAEKGVGACFEDHGSSRSLYFSDPDGNVIELTTSER